MVDDDFRLWVVAFFTFGLGDLLTTMTGLEVGLVEIHPLYAGLLPDGLLVIALIVKFVLFALFIALYHVVPSPASRGIPIGLSLLGIAVTAWNSLLILTVIT